MCNLYSAADLMRLRLRNMRSFIVIDNVAQIEQLEKLALNRAWLGAGSRVIIISRDKHILREYGVDAVHTVQLLNYDNALKLFCTKAFKCDEMMRDYQELTYDAVQYAKGLPLAIKVLGSFLFGRDVSGWRSALAKLREYPNKDILNVLRVSFDGLDDMEKEIFLDIACFFYDESETYVKKILHSRGFYSEIGIQVLKDKSLITNDQLGTIQMHGLLKELGRSIVRGKSPNEPRKWSRLWNYEDLQNVMLKNMAAENLEAIVMQIFRNCEYKIPYPFEGKNSEIQEITMRADALSKMSHLKFLILRDVNFSGSLNYLSNELGYLFWDKYPFTCLPSSFQPDKLVELKLPNSSIKQLWEGIKSLPNLRRMDLSHSKNLTKMPDFGQVPNLERLTLEGCIKLVKIDPSIGILRKLTDLNLKNCKNLVSIPNNIFHLSSLEYLNLSGCSKLFKNQLLENPRHAEHLEKLDINESTIQCQSTSFVYKILTLPFRVFYSRTHEDSGGLLLPSLPRLACLRDLDLSFCNLPQIPDAIGWLHCLERLNLGGNNFVTLPSTIKQLSQLLSLNLEHCKQLKYLPELPSSIVLPERRGTCFGRYRAGLYIFNCPNLSETEHCHNIAFSWMIQFLKVHMQSSLPFGQIQIVIPGSGIPRWFINQNVGSSISIDPSSVEHDQNWIGIACCAVFVAHDDPTNLRDSIPPYLGLGFQKKGSGIYPMIPIHFEKDLVTVESDHLMLLFFTREEFVNHYVNYLSDGSDDLYGIKLAISFPSLRGLHMEVKNCGYRWVFEENLEQLNTRMMHGGNVSVRKRKLLTMDSSNSIPPTLPFKKF